MRENGHVSSLRCAQLAVPVVILLASLLQVENVTGSRQDSVPFQSLAVLHTYLRLNNLRLVSMPCFDECRSSWADKKLSETGAHRW